MNQWEVIDFHIAEFAKLTRPQRHPYEQSVMWTTLECGKWP